MIEWIKAHPAMTTIIIGMIIAVWFVLKIQREVRGDPNLAGANAKDFKNMSRKQQKKYLKNLR